MPYYRTTRVIPIIFTILIVAGVLAALVSVVRMFILPKSTSETSQTALSQKSLITVSAERSVKMTVRGPIVGEEDFRSYTIEVSPNKRTLSIYKGYQGKLIGSKVLENSSRGYGEFVYSLYNAGFMSNVPETDKEVEYRGLCSTKNLYTFEMLKSGKTESKLWTTSCSGTAGNLNTKLKPLVKLFNAQIPEAESTINELWQ